MNEKEVYQMYAQEFQAKMKIMAQSNSQIEQILQFSEALSAAYIACEGNQSLFRIKREQLYKQQGSLAIDWEQNYTALQSEISQLKTALLLANTDSAIYKGQLEMNGIDPAI